jgi:hypothetical protein
MEAPVSRVVVFRLASRAHRELRHGGLRPVVGNTARDREPRPAVGAVQEGIPVAPVAWVQQFAQAVRASRGIGWNPGAYRPQTSLTTIRKPNSPVAANSRTATESIRASGGASLRNRFRNASTRVSLPLDLDGHPVGIVADEARQALLQGQPVDKRAESYALHHAAYYNALPQRRRSARFSFWLGLFSQRQASRRRQA